MGLDMRPMGKPKKGFEKRYVEIFNIVSGKEEQKLTRIEKFSGKKLKSKEELLQEWFDNQIQSYESIKAPKVGRDEVANNWATTQYEHTEKEKSLEDFLAELQGYYVINLAKEKDGVPVYKAFGQDENVFRGEFLRSCVDLIGQELVAEAWQTKLSAETLDYGKRLMAAGDKVAGDRGLEYVKDQRNPPPDASSESDAARLHIVYALAKWLIFYGENGHGYQADY